MHSSVGNNKQTNISHEINTQIVRMIFAVSNVKVLFVSSASGMLLACSYILDIFQPRVLTKRLLWEKGVYMYLTRS